MQSRSPADGPMRRVRRRTRPWMLNRPGWALLRGGGELRFDRSGVPSVLPSGEGWEIAPSSRPSTRGRVRAEVPETPPDAATERVLAAGTATRAGWFFSSLPVSLEELPTAPDSHFVVHIPFGRSGFRVSGRPVSVRMLAQAIRCSPDWGRRPVVLAAGGRVTAAVLGPVMSSLSSTLGVVVISSPGPILMGPRIMLAEEGFVSRAPGSTKQTQLGRVLPAMRRPRIPIRDVNRAAPVPPASRASLILPTAGASAGSPPPPVIARSVEPPAPRAVDRPRAVEPPLVKAVSADLFELPPPDLALPDLSGLTQLVPPPAVVEEESGRRDAVVGDPVEETTPLWGTLPESPKFGAEPADRAPGEDPTPAADPDAPLWGTSPVAADAGSVAADPVNPVWGKADLDRSTPARMVAGAADSFEDMLRLVEAQQGPGAVESTASTAPAGSTAPAEPVDSAVFEARTSEAGAFGTDAFATQQIVNPNLAGNPGPVANPTEVPAGRPTTGEESADDRARFGRSGILNLDDLELSGLAEALARIEAGRPAGGSGVIDPAGAVDPADTPDRSVPPDAPAPAFRAGHSEVATPTGAAGGPAEKTAGGAVSQDAVPQDVVGHDMVGRGTVAQGTVAQGGADPAATPVASGPAAAPDPAVPIASGPAGAGPAVSGPAVPDRVANPAAETPSTAETSSQEEISARSEGIAQERDDAEVVEEAEAIAQASLTSKIDLDSFGIGTSGLPGGALPGVEVPGSVPMDPDPVGTDRPTKPSGAQRSSGATTTSASAQESEATSAPETTGSSVKTQEPEAAQVTRGTPAAEDVPQHLPEAVEPVGAVLEILTELEFPPVVEATAIPTEEPEELTALLVDEESEAAGAESQEPAEKEPSPIEERASWMPIGGDAQRDDREQVRSLLGWRYEAHSRAITGVLALQPGLRASAGRGDLMIGLVAVRAHLAGASAVVDAVLRGEEIRPGGGFAEIDPAGAALLARCARSGLSRLPAVVGPVFRAGNPDTTQLKRYRSGLRLVEPAFTEARLVPSSAGESTVEYAIWSSTARRTDRVTGPGGDGGTRVLFAPGTQFVVLDVEQPEDGDQLRVLLRELPASATPDEAVDERARERLRESMQLVQPTAPTQPRIPEQWRYPLGMRSDGTLFALSPQPEGARS
ncbi:hypothetical protein [Kineosporia sp. NBRC 101731]|uniref:hypothetical protein n=1 Tax=Kineosporia sp. NBRC 101731 TaxID=3032199 RepID=UPI0024A03B7B|nr:hypothetical protein [Kineosporia sp. NBRC 101731]GLY31384.1 hypothetical protein Kisp02_47490 [Kineosporia sp. NBRC 101731]